MRMLMHVFDSAPGFAGQAVQRRCRHWDVVHAGLLPGDRGADCGSWPAAAYRDRPKSTQTGR